MMPSLDDLKKNCFYIIYELFDEYPELKTILRRQVADMNCYSCLEEIERELQSLSKLCNLKG